VYTSSSSAVEPHFICKILDTRARGPGIKKGYMRIQWYYRRGELPVSLANRSHPKSKYTKN